MAIPTKADELLPLVAGLAPQERVRLIRLIAEQRIADEAALYRTLPPQGDEFSRDDDHLDWDADGWDEFT